MIFLISIQHIKYIFYIVYDILTKYWFGDQKWCIVYNEIVLFLNGVNIKKTIVGRYYLFKCLKKIYFDLILYFVI